MRKCQLTEALNSSSKNYSTPFWGLVRFAADLIITLTEDITSLKVSNFKHVVTGLIANGDSDRVCEQFTPSSHLSKSLN